MIFAPINLVCQDGTVEAEKRDLSLVSDIARDLLTEDPNITEIVLAASCTTAGVRAMLTAFEEEARKQKNTLTVPDMLQAVVVADHLKV